EGVFVRRYRANDPGIYRVPTDVRRQGADAVSAGLAILIGGADPEMTDPRQNGQILQRIAAPSGGRMVGAGHAAALADQLRAAVPAAKVMIRRDLWHNAWSFAAIVALLAGE